jgi:hypothetical protein
MVAALPMFDAVASASRYGSGGSRLACTTPTTIGVKIKQIVSLTNSADSTPAAATRVTSRTFGPLALRASHPAAAARPPESFR